MTDPGGNDAREPERMCVICGRRFAKSGLARHVMDEAGKLIVDEYKIMPGRGFYLCQDKACEAKFARRRQEKKLGKGGRRQARRGEA